MIEFKKDTHQYFNGTKELISVTTLMRKHGLGPDYSMVKGDILEKKAERGTLIHAEIEAFNKRGEIGFTEEMAAYKRYIEENNIKCVGSETIVYNDIVAGTVDLFLQVQKKLVIADIKTTAVLHKEPVAWQLSIYNFLNGWQAEKAQVFHFDNDANLKVVDISFKPKEEIERLMQCERDGVIFQQKQILIAENQLEVIRECEQIIAEAEHKKKAAEEEMAAIKGAIMKAMEQNGVKSFENDNIKMTYIEGGTRTTVDTAKLKKEKPEIVEEYEKSSKVKPSLRIKIKVEKRPSTEKAEEYR